MTTATYGDPRGEVFRPRYRAGAWTGVVIPVLLAAGLAAVSTALGVPAWGVIALAALPLPAAVLFGWLFWYRKIEFGPERIALRRPLLPDVVHRYEEVEALGPGSFVLAGRPVPWRQFRNGQRLAGHLRRLRWEGVVDAARTGAGEERAETGRMAAVGSAAIVAGGIAGAASVGVPAGGVLLTAAVLAACCYPLARVLLYRLGAGTVAAAGEAVTGGRPPDVGAGLRREVA